MSLNKPFAEIVESSLDKWTGQCWSWDHFPAFGSMVAIHTPLRTTFGIVYQVQTGSLDPVRYPFTYQKTEEELRAEQPQIFEFLKTTFSCVALGYKEKGRLYHLFTPEPPKIHAFVEPLSNELAHEFFQTQGYLNLLFSHSNTIQNIDELLLSLLKQQLSLRIVSQEHLDTFISQYSLLTGNDYRRLKIFLQRVEQML